MIILSYRKKVFEVNNKKIFKIKDFGRIYDILDNMSYRTWNPKSIDFPSILRDGVKGGFAIWPFWKKTIMNKKLLKVSLCNPFIGFYFKIKN